jgi:hypothetical protein
VGNQGARSGTGLTATDALQDKARASIITWSIEKQMNKPIADDICRRDELMT